MGEKKNQTKNLSYVTNACNEPKLVAASLGLLASASLKIIVFMSGILTKHCLKAFIYFFFFSEKYLIANDVSFSNRNIKVGKGYL